MWNWIKDKFSHHNLREIATTLNFFNLIEIVITGWVIYEVHRLLDWYMKTSTPDTFNGVAFWGAISAIIAGLFSALKFIHDTLKVRLEQKND